MEEVIKSYIEERNMLLEQLKLMYKFPASSADDINSVFQRLREIDTQIIQYKD